MSRQNKVNPNHYTMAGRLTPDDLARERKQQAGVRGGTRRSKPMAPWMTKDTNEANQPQGGDRQEAEFDLAASEGAPLPRPTEEWPAESAQEDSSAAPPAARKAAPKPRTPAAKAAPKAARKAAPNVARKAARKTAGKTAVKTASKTAGRTAGKTTRKTTAKASGARATLRVSEPTARAGRPSAPKGRSKGAAVRPRAAKKR